MSNLLPTRPSPTTQRCSFAIVASQYNADYVRGLIDHVKSELEVISPGAPVALYEVPGAFEIPLIVREVAARGGIDAILALGVIIEGQTGHARLIAQAVTDALQRLAIEYRVPVIHEVLLVRDEAQARARCLGDELNRGIEAARTAVKMARIFHDMSNPQTSHG